MIDQIVTVAIGGVIFAFIWTTITILANRSTTNE